MDRFARGRTARRPTAPRSLAVPVLTPVRRDGGGQQDQAELASAISVGRRLAQMGSPMVRRPLARGRWRFLPGAVDDDDDGSPRSPVLPGGLPEVGEGDVVGQGALTCQPTVRWGSKLPGGRRWVGCLFVGGESGAG